MINLFNDVIGASIFQLFYSKPVHTIFVILAKVFEGQLGREMKQGSVGKEVEYAGQTLLTAWR